MSTRSVSLRSGLALWALSGLAASSLGMQAGVAAPAADPQAVHDRDPAGWEYDFDLPAQPLDRALDRFGLITRMPTVFPSSLIAGRTASPVLGRHAPEQALRLLLEGTGLAAERIDSAQGSVFVLARPRRAPPTPPKGGTAGASAAAGVARLFPDPGYPAMAQARIWRALCTDPLAAPGRYRSVLRFEIDAGGRVGRARLLVPSGDERRDAALLAALQGVRLDAPSPGLARQPLTLALLPAQPGGPRCEGEAARP